MGPTWVLSAPCLPHIGPIHEPCYLGWCTIIHVVVEKFVDHLFPCFSAGWTSSCNGIRPTTTTSRTLSCPGMKYGHRTSYSLTRKSPTLYTEVSLDWYVLRHFICHYEDGLWDKVTLTHWDRDREAVTVQMTFFKFIFALKYCSISVPKHPIYNKPALIVIMSVPERQHVITWTDDALVDWLIYALQCLNGLTKLSCRCFSWNVLHKS